MHICKTLFFRTSNEATRVVVSYTDIFLCGVDKVKHVKEGVNNNGVRVSNECDSETAAAMPRSS